MHRLTNIPTIERERLAAATDLAATKRAFDAAVTDAQRRGARPTADIVVRQLKRNLNAAKQYHARLVDLYHAALRDSSAAAACSSSTPSGSPSGC